MLPDDPKLDVELVTEQSGEPHQFLRKRSDHTWCRESEEVCGLHLGDNFNKKVDEAAKKAKTEHVVVPPPTRTRQPFDMKRIGAPTETPQMLGTNLSSVKLKPGQDALYIVKDSEGTVLKVGKTSDLGAKGRFSVYKRGGKLTNKTIEIEVYPLEVQPRPLSRTAKNAEFYESKLRSSMESDGHTMPWDNTKQRLGYEGFGTPGEGVRTAKVTRERIQGLLEKYKGNRKLVGQELGIHSRTVDLWAQSLGLKTTDFRK